MSDDVRPRSVRFSEKEAEAIDRAAEAAGKTPHSWMRDVLLIAAGASQFTAQVAPFAYQAPGLSQAADDFVLASRGSPLEKDNWLFVYRDAHGRPEIVVGHQRPCSNSVVKLEIGHDPNGRVLRLPRADLIAWQKLKDLDSDMRSAVMEWQRWGAHLHRLVNVERRAGGVLPAWPEMDPRSRDRATR